LDDEFYDHKYTLFVEGDSVLSNKLHAVFTAIERADDIW